MLNMSKAEMKAMFRAADTDEDGEISFKEYKKMVREEVAPKSELETEILYLMPGNAKSNSPSISTSSDEGVRVTSKNRDEQGVQQNDFRNVLKKKVDVKTQNEDSIRAQNAVQTDLRGNLKPRAGVSLSK